jgi:hypothetical protein
LPSGELVGASPGTDDGNGVGRGTICVTAGPGCVIGRDALGAFSRGRNVVFAARGFGFGLGFADFFAAGRLDAAFFLDATFFLRAGAARFFDFTTFFLVCFLAFALALLFFAMIYPPSR